MTTAVILAAGESKRIPNQNKLLSLVDGVAILIHSVTTILRAGISDVIVVTGHEANPVRHALSNYAVRFAHNADYRDGMSTSLRVGLRSVSPKSNSALICLGDMPGIRAQSIRMLGQAFDPEQPRICVPIYAGNRGHPVLWPAIFFPEMMMISGDRGARHLLVRNKDAVARVNQVLAENP